MSLTGDKYDPYNPWYSVGNEFGWHWDFGGVISGILQGDQYGPGPVPHPQPVILQNGAISEVPQTWEEAAETNPEWFEPILETRPGHVADSYPQDVPDSQLPDDEEDMTHTWGHLALETATTIVGGWLGGGDDPTTVYNPPSAFAPTMGPSTPANQAATAVAMQTGCDGMAWSGGTPPKGYKVVNHCGVGVLRKVRRRRRRRMLTASDASDLATIVGIVGKGQMAAQMINRR